MIQAGGKVLLPGFVQLHIHLCQTLFRGRADDLELIDWLKGRIWPLEDHGAEVPKALMENTQASLKESVELLEKWHGFDRGRVKYAFNPRFVVSCTVELLIGVRDLAAQYNVKVNTHA